jgi:hypothetical protein
LSPDELIVTVGAIVVGPILWIVWLVRMSRLQTLQRRRIGMGAIAGTLAACAVLVFAVLETVAAYDVVDAPQYQFMYLVLGLAWVRATAITFGFVGLSPRDDLIERANRAAVPAVAGALVAVSLCYAGANIGDGPGWWVVLFSAMVSTATLMVFWAALTRFTPIADAVTIDRDPAAGLRLGAFLISSGLILGRAVAGDWSSAAETLADFSVFLPAAVAVLMVATVTERLAKPTPQRPHAPLFTLGVLPSLLYLALSVSAVSMMDWPA